MASKDPRRSISVRGETWRAVRAYADVNGTSISDLTEKYLRDLVGLPPVQKTVTSEPVLPSSMARTTSGVPPAPTRRVVIDGDVRAAAAKKRRRTQERLDKPSTMQSALPSRDKVSQPTAPSKYEVPSRGPGTVFNW